ncbi:MAG: AraC family transcriptional regulator ligand-binding domain-containing protein [Gammaproteobacteria bacterium]|nr:AraC family transcriptional regulator ligand-binding domain-containing protein [Gammaproteobacteria bacterium]
MAVKLEESAQACIPSNYSRIIGRELGLQIRDIPKLLKFTGLSSKQFMQEDTLLTAQQQIHILHNGLNLSSHADFGLRLGRRLTPSTHGAMGFLVNSSPNLYIALKAFQSYLPTRINFASINLLEDESSVTCSINFDTNLHPDILRALSETCAVIFNECAEFIVGRPVVEASLKFIHDQPNYSHSYSDYLSGSYSFSAPNLQMSIPLAICKIPNASADLENYVVAMRQCETMLAQLKSHEHSIRYQIEKMMLSHPLGELSEEDAAAALFICKRTLARRLKEEGMSFRKIRDKILSQQAINFLCHRNMSIDSIATLLNYHDSANFRRAFKRWFNMSPNDYRKQSSKESIDS